MVLKSVPALPNPNPILSVSPSTKTSKPIQFYISALNYDVGLDVSGVLNNVLVDLPQCDAECVYNVQIGLLQSVFKIYLDNLAISDPSYNFLDASSNARYYVFTKNWTNMDLNVANARVIDGAIATVSNNKLMLTKQDFLRHLAKGLFGTYLATDLFSNEQGMLNDIGILSHNAWVTQMNILNKIAATPNAVVSLSDPSYNVTLQTYSKLRTDPSGNKFLTNLDSTTNNITYQLIAMINARDPGRLAIDFSNQTIGADGLAGVPFRVGDALYFYTTLNPTPGQESLTGVSAIPTRTYVLKINIIGDSTTPTNIVPLEYGSTVTKYAEYCLGSFNITGKFSGNSTTPLIMHYTFDSLGANNTLYNNVTQQYDAIIASSGSISTTDYKTGTGSLKLNSGYVTSTSGFTTGTTGVSFAFWLKCNTSDYSRVFNFSSATRTNSIFLLISQNQIGISVSNGAAYGDRFNIYSLNVNNNIWRHITWTINTNGTNLLYINGIFVTTFTSNYPTSINRSIKYFGQNEFGNPLFTGSIDDFRIYNGILTQSQITSLVT